MYVIIVIVAVLVSVFVYLATLPSTATVRHSRKINVPASAAYNAVLDFKTWPLWDPWSMHEPSVEHSYSENWKDVGGSHRWEGKYIGTGQVEHIEIEADKLIKQALTFIKPFRAQAISEWNFTEEDGGCTVEWIYNGKIPFLMRFMVKSIVRYLEGDYKLGLDRLAMYLDPKEEQYSFVFEGMQKFPASHFVHKEYSGSMEGLPEFIGSGFTELFQKLAKEKIQMVGSPFAAYWKMNMRAKNIQSSVAIPVDPSTKTELPTADIPETKTIVMRYTGRYDHLPLAWSRLMMQVKMMRQKASMPCLEVYETDPNETKAEENVTLLYATIK